MCANITTNTSMCLFIYLFICLFVEVNIGIFVPYLFIIYFPSHITGMIIFLLH